QIGAGIGSLVAGSLRLPVASRRKLMAAGMGAGVGALFHAPLAGALFAAELLYRDLDLEYEVLVPAIVASVTGHTLYSRVFGFEPLFDTPQNAFGRPQMLLLYILLALVLAQGARLYTWAFWTAHDRFSRIKAAPWVRTGLGGLATGLVGLAVPAALGSGYGTLQDALRFDGTWTLGAHGGAFALLLGVFFAKTAATAFSVGSGGSGGIFGPALVCGGALGGATGMLFATLLPSWGVNPGSFVLVGMVAFFGCAAKTPISMILMIGEMTGNHRLLVPSMWVVVIAYLLTRRVSLYRSQLPNRFEAPVHRPSLVSGTLGCITVRDVLGARRGGGSFETVSAVTPLSRLFDLFSSGAQAVFPVAAADGTFAGVVSRRDLDSVAAADPVFRRTMLVGDLALAPHPVTTGPEPLRKVLATMDSDDAEAIVVVEGPASRRRATGILSHNDIAAAYRAEIATVR
ncbi:MAG: chloride channel protein, partial [Kiritimatiellae bacterium]|nr:chloride channel protein [Kiritimatiellia bacterium]